MEAMLAQYRQAEPGQIEARAVDHLVVLEAAGAQRGPWVGCGLAVGIWGWGWGTENAEIFRESGKCRAVFFCFFVCFCP